MRRISHRNGAFLVLIMLCLGLRTAKAQFSTHPLQEENPDILLQNQSYNYNLGYRFTANSDGNITQLGGRWADGVVHTVRLYAYPSGNVLATANVTGSMNWNYVTLLSPVAITAGSRYVVAVRMNNQNSAVVSDMLLPVSTGGITITNATYRIASNNMPTNSVINAMYGQADVTFEPCVYAGSISSAKNNLIPGDSTILSLTNNVGSIQWQVSTDGFTFSNITGASSSTLATGPVTSTTFYRTYVSNNGCANDTSPAFVLKVIEPFYPLQTHEPGITSQNINWNYNMGYRFTALKNGKVTQLAGRWADGVVHTVRLYAYPSGTVLATANVTGSMNWNYANLGSPVSLTAGNQYVVAVRLTNQSSGCQGDFIMPVTSAGIRIDNATYRNNSNNMPANSITGTIYGMADLRFEPCAYAGFISADNDLLSKGSNTTLYVTGNTSTVQWQSSLNNTTFTNIAGATANTLNTGALTQTTYYRTITTTGCGSDISQSIKITVFDPDYVLQGTGIDVTTQDEDWNVNMGYRFTALANGTVSQLGGRWKDGVAHIVRLYAYPSGTVLASVNMTGSMDWAYANITPVTLTAGSQYVVAVRLTSVSSGVSTSMNLPVISGQIRIDNCTYRNNSNNMPTNSETSAMYGQADIKFDPCVYSGVITNHTPEICPGESGSFSTTDYNGNLQWQSSANKSIWTNISGATSATLNIASLNTTTYYRLRASAGCGTHTSAIDSIVVIGSSGGVAGLWTGLKDNQWNNACNWNNGSVPAANSSVIIPPNVTPPANIPAITLNSLTINNRSGITLTNDMTITNSLILIDGNIKLNNQNLTLGSSIGITGGYSTSYIEVNNNGQLRKQYTTANGSSFFLPVGDNLYFAPVTLDLNPGTSVSAGAYIALQTYGTLHASIGNPGNYISRFWRISASGITNPNFDIQLQYHEEDINGTESSMNPLRYNNGWSLHGSISTLLNTITMNGLSAFGDFTAADEIAYISAASGTWNTGSSWQGGIAPNLSINNIIILNGHDISLTQTQQVKDVTINTGGRLILNGNTLNVNGDLIVNGTLDSSGTVRFTGSETQQIAGAGDVFGSIEINNASGVNITAGDHGMTGTLTLTAGTFNTNGALTLISNAAGTARVNNITGGSITGNVTVQRFIDAGNTNWRFLSSPVNNAALAGWKDDFITSGFTGSHYPTFPFVSIYTYNESSPGDKTNGYTIPSNISDILTPGKGYWVWCGDTSTGTQPFTVDVSGPLNTGNISLPLTFTDDPAQPATEDGWNLAGNPYASTIDWDAAGWTKTNVNNAIYIWDPDAQQYKAYVAGISTNGGSRFIASSQAFWVQTNGASPVLTARESVKSATDQSFVRSMRPDENIAIKINSWGYKDETVIRFNESATDTFDLQLDARKIYSNYVYSPALSSVYNGNDLAINSIPSLNEDISIPLKAKVGFPSIYDLNIKMNVLKDHYSCIIFEDRHSGISFNLEKDTTYSCFISDTLKSTRFWIHLGAPVQRNVSEISCTGSQNGAIAVTAQGDGPWNYTWTTLSGDTLSSFNGSFPIDRLENLDAGNYVVFIDNYGKCGSISDTFTLVDPLPVLAKFFCDTTMELNEGARLEFLNASLNAMEYEWDFGDGDTETDQTPVHTYQMAGKYLITLKVTGKNDCSDSASREINITDQIVSIATSPLKDQLNVFPNPAGGNEVKFNRPVTGTLFDSMGRTVMEVWQTSRLDIENFDAGVYILKSIEGEQVKMVISR